jgi:DNA-binding CsgD family transcriptional regulator
VKPFDVAEAFLELHGRRVPLPELQRAFENSLHELGMRHFACLPHADPLNPRNAGLVFQSCPTDWVRYFDAGSPDRIEPVFRYADEKMLPFFWDDPDFRAVLTPSQVEILAAAAGRGLSHGYTVPLHPPGGPPASCSVVPDPGAIERGAYQAAFTMVCFMFDALLQNNARTGCSETRGMQYSARERQCLELAAQGKDDWSIGSLLRISERTAHNHIERAKRRLGVCTRVQVIVHALSDGQISFGDVIKAETPHEPSRELRKKTN